MSSNNVKRPVESGEEEGHKKARFATLSQDQRALKVVQESQVGITSYINEQNKSGGGFIGSIKQLYSDFQVNEIDLNGEVVHLKDEGIDMGKSKRERRLEKRDQERDALKDMTPEEVEQYKEAKRLEEEAKKEQEKPKYQLSEEHRTELLTHITSEELAQVEELFTTGNNMETKTSFEDKQARGKLHQLFRQAFQGQLETITSPENTFKIAIAKKGQGRGNGRAQHPQESMHHVDENGVLNYGLGPFKPYLHLTVYKENRETMEVASTIAKFIRFPTKAIGFAGTKDRRGVTCQRFSIHRGKVVRINSLNKALKGSILGGFSYEDKSLGLGDLKGNQFLITIRDVESLNEDKIEDVVSECFNSLKDKGFINYYGMQRFGSFSISTHELGKHMLNEDWKSVVELILSEQEVVAPDSVEARRIWAETSNPSLTLKKMPHRFSAEHSILKVLEKEPLNDNEEFSSHSYFKAIMAIPKNLRIMYGHAYQSYIWNLVASKRIELFGLEAQVGDLVYDSSPKEVDEADKDENGEEFVEDVAVSKDVRVKPLTQEDIESGKYSIYDVILPGPGYKITYPTNETLRNVYVETMAKDGLDPFKMTRRVKEFSLAGSYRHLISKPENLSYELIKYKDNDVPLVKTDLEILRENKAEKSPEEKIELPDLNDISSRIINTDPVAEKLAIVLKMQLGVSSYATMALREFMKADTSRFGVSMVKPEDKDAE